MIKYVVLEDQRKIYGILENTELDAVKRINKIVTGSEDVFSVYNKKYLMPRAFKVCSVCDPRDTWDVEVGKDIVKRKLLKHYYDSLDKRMNMFKSDLIVLNSRVWPAPAEY